MPTQMEVEYWRNQYQRMNKERFLAANSMALLTHTLVSATAFYRLINLLSTDPTYGRSQDKDSDTAGG